MPAYLHIAEPQEIRQEEERRKQLREELEKCTRVKGTFRNKIYRFLVDNGIQHLTEIDYPLRCQFKAYAKQNFLKKQQNVMVSAFDRIRQQAVWEEQKTLAGKQKYKLKYENTLMFLKYLPDREIAEKYTTAREENHLLWDFRISCPETLKQQVFRGVCSISISRSNKGLAPDASLPLGATLWSAPPKPSFTPGHRCRSKPTDRSNKQQKTLTIARCCDATPSVF